METTEESLERLSRDIQEAIENKQKEIDALRAVQVALSKEQIKLNPTGDRT